MMDQDQQISEFQNQVNVSRETIERLKTYHDLLVKWNPVINLVSNSTIDTIWQRHFLDSAQLWKLSPQSARLWIDLGSGAGFPGLVIAILAAEQETPLNIELVESDARKSAFLLNTTHTLGLKVKIHTVRIEELAPVTADVVSARALAPLMQIFEYSEPFLGNNTVLLLPKGKNVQLELTNAQKYWTFTLQKPPSVTDPDGVILKIEGLGRV